MKTIKSLLKGNTMSQVERQISSMFKKMFPEFKVKFTDNFFEQYIEEGDLGETFKNQNELIRVLKKHFYDFTAVDYVFTADYSKQQFLELVNKYNVDFLDLEEKVDQYSEEIEYRRPSELLGVVILDMYKDEWIPELASILWNNMEEV